nr:MAG TPA: hypothetical protein [Caudoviricetes sp.]
MALGDSLLPRIRHIMSFAYDMLLMNRNLLKRMPVTTKHNTLLD